MGDFLGFRVAPGNPARLRRNSLATLSFLLGIAEISLKMAYFGPAD
jgi:hypothetical protein